MRLFARIATCAGVWAGAAAAMLAYSDHRTERYTREENQAYQMWLEAYNQEG